MIENNVFTHNGVPCLDYLDERSKKVALAINAQTVMRTSGNPDSEPIVELQPRVPVNRALVCNTTGTVTARYTAGTRETSELLGVWENFIPGLTAVVALVGDPVNANLASIKLCLVSDLSTNYNLVTISPTFDVTNLLLRNAYSKAFTMIENGHLFVIVQDIGVAKELIMVDLWLFRCTQVSTTVFQSADNPFVRFNGTTNILINPLNSTVALVSVAGFTNNGTYIDPQRAGVFDTTNLTVTTVNPFNSLGAANGETLQMLAYSTQNLRTGYYYPTNTRLATVTLPTGDTSVKLPDALASNFHIDENLCSNSIVVASDLLIGSGRLGNAVVNLGFNAATAFASVELPKRVESPVTAINNSHPFGYNFLQWVQAKASPFQVSVVRSRLAPPVNSKFGVVTFTDSGAGHFRLSSVGFGTPGIDSAVIAAQDRGGAGVGQDDGSCMTTLYGNYQGLVNIPQSQMLGFDTYNGVHVPFCKRGRIQVSNEAIQRTTPLFGINTNDIKDIFDVGNGRLAIVTKSNEITISSPVRTWNNFPSFLDFQVLVGVPSGLTAERYRLTPRSITSIIAYQAGYLVTTTEGLFSINSITGVISKVNDDNCLGVVATGGLYLSVNMDSTYAVYQYDDRIKQVSELFRGNVNSVLATSIGTDYKKFNNSSYSYYLSRKNVVIAKGSNFVYFLDENNILHNHNFASSGISYCGRVLSSLTTPSDSSYGRDSPFLATFAFVNNPGNMSDSILSSATTLTFNNVSANIYNLGFSRYGSVDPILMTLTQIAETLTSITAIPYDTHMITTLSYPVVQGSNNVEYVEHNQTAVDIQLSNNTPNGTISVILNTLFFRSRFASINLATTAINKQMDTLVGRLRFVSRLTYAKVAYWITVKACGISSVTTSSSPQKVNKR
jgi:hypothetical protein